ncbi:unnamed protein product [Arabidopsis lyrata]|uniref:Predicted protein n=1 Tax=Arabidopsis lyrata subsp. lyrata TaxID=81972 RepID=D7LN32_ARALL|nr:predicted protein [Arabidopsis lyrata subsp. lyrata]CAH8267666.1 unnamed protein product [Arabidopsis lyrata]
MRAWGVTQPCVFCGEPTESRDHLFFACPYTFTIWFELTSPLLRHKLTPDWSQTLLSLRSTQLKLHDKTLARLAFQASVYLLWRERNGRIHNQCSNSSTTMLKTIDKAIKERISSLKSRKGSNFEELQVRWTELRGG